MSGQIVLVEPRLRQAGPRAVCERCNHRSTIRNPVIWEPRDNWLGCGRDTMHRFDRVCAECREELKRR